MRNEDDNSSRDALAVLDLGRDGAVWIVLCCPWCGEVHVHGAGTGVEAATFLGPSRSDCGHGYTLHAAPLMLGRRLQKLQTMPVVELHATYAKVVAEDPPSRAKKDAPALRKRVAQELCDAFFRMRPSRRPPGVVEPYWRTGRPAQ